jgi:hypothetical protein
LLNICFPALSLVMTVLNVSVPGAGKGAELAAAAVEAGSAFSTGFAAWA